MTSTLFRLIGFLRGFALGFLLRREGACAAAHVVKNDFVSCCLGGIGVIAGRVVVGFWRPDFNVDEGLTRDFVV
jgi:hypothetical protein